MKIYDCPCGILQARCMHECDFLELFEREDREKIIEKVTGG